MKTKYVYITSNEWFENLSLKNPISIYDHNIEHFYAKYYSINYDLKVLATKVPTEEEKSMPSYNDYREKYGSTDVSVIDSAIALSPAKNIFLNGFNQEQFEYIAPLLKEPAEILYNDAVKSMFKDAGIEMGGTLMDQEYKRICDKLGFIPSEYQLSQTDGEDDNWENPFLILTPDEINYLYRNGYLN